MGQIKSLYSKILKGIPFRISTFNFKQVFWSIIKTVLILGISYIILFPILTKISSSIMSEQDLFDKTVKWIPRHITLENYVLVWKAMDYPSAFLNSFLLSVSISILQLFSCTLIGYGLARFDFRGSNILFAIVIFMLIVPPQVIIIPLYMNFRFFDLFGLLFNKSINMINTYWPFYLLAITGTGMRNGLYIYIMRQFFRGMPQGLEEAAYVDGAGPFRTFFKVMLPGAVPALVIVFLFSFVWQWNDNYFVSVFVGGQNLLANNLSSLARTISGTGDDMSLMISRQKFSMINNTGSLLFITPLILLYGFMQRYFIESIERTGLVG